MARRKISVQRKLGTHSSEWEQPLSAIEDLTSGMATVDLGFEPTDQRIYMINLNRIYPDPDQPRHLLPHDLRDALNSQRMTATQVIEALLARAAQNDTLALLVLGGKDDKPVDEGDVEVEEKSLFALARSIREVGLRQPVNVYQVDDTRQHDRIAYRIGEGERRFWAHHLLVQQGHEAFQTVKCIIEPLPDDDELIYQRQAAENAARIDLPAIARARSIQRVKEQLSKEMGKSGSRINQRQLQQAIGQQVRVFTGRTVGDRMVRNYLSLLKLSPEAQDLAEAGQLTEKQLRPLASIEDPAEQVHRIKQTILERWSSRQVLEQVRPPAEPKKVLKEMQRKTPGEKFENQLMTAAKAIASLLSEPLEDYEKTVTVLAIRARDSKTKEVLESLHEALTDVLDKATALSEAKIVELSLAAFRPPLDELEAILPADKFLDLQHEGLSGSQIMEHLLAWRENDAILASHLRAFFTKVETHAESLRAGEVVLMPTAKRIKNAGEGLHYQITLGSAIYWAYELLALQGLVQFQVIQVELVEV